MREIADLMNLEKGDDYVEIHVVDGQVIVKKETKRYGNFDFESEEITDALLKYEKGRIDSLSDIVEPEEMERIAREQYEKDRAERLARKKKNA